MHAILVAVLAEEEEMESTVCSNDCSQVQLYGLVARSHSHAEKATIKVLFLYAHYLDSLFSSTNQNRGNGEYK